MQVTYSFIGKTLVLAAVCVLAGCQGGQERAEKTSPALPTASVSVQAVESGVMHGGATVPGTVQAVRRAAISAKVSGQIVDLPIKLGSRVAAGELLARISVEEIGARLQQAETQLAQAERNLAREKALLEKKAATAESVRNLEEAARIARAGRQEAATMTGYAAIKAPFAGVVTRKLAEVGDLATPGQPLLQLEDEGRLQALVQVPESLVGRLRIGDRAPVQVPAVGRSFDGEIVEIAPAVEPDSRTTLVKFNLPVTTELRSGQFARVELGDAGRESLFAPLAALSRLGQMERVFVAENNKASMRLVRSGAQQGGMVEILSGLAAGEQVVVNGAAGLRDGQSLEIR